MEICRRRSQLHFKIPVEKVNFKILQYHEIKREEGPTRRPEDQTHLTFEDKRVQAFYFCERTEAASLEIRKVVPQKNAVNTSRGKSNLYSIQ